METQLKNNTADRAKTVDNVIPEMTENFKQAKSLVISTNFNFNDYEMPANDPDPKVHIKMKRFYQEILKNSKEAKQDSTRRLAESPYLDNILKFPLQKKDYWGEELENTDSAMQKKTIHKKEAIIPNGTENYDNLRGEYLAEMEKNKNNSILKDENDNEATRKLCLEDSGFGITALKCVNKIPKNQQLYLATKLIMFWSAMGFLVLFCFWSAKGWCCCCCPFKFCKVEERINTIQRFVAENPPGKWNENGKLYEYEPTQEERLIYKKITRAFMDI